MPATLCTFAAVIMNRKRHIASWTLLAVFVPMLLLSSLHIHSYNTLAYGTCTECVHHHCAGHLGQQTPSVHDCVLCQFLSLPMLAVAVATLILYNKLRAIAYATVSGSVCLSCCSMAALRGPPAV